jgi:hypothetical protein
MNQEHGFARISVILGVLAVCVGLMAVGNQYAGLISAASGPSVTVDQCDNGGVGKTPIACDNPGNPNNHYGSGNVNGQKAHWAEGDVLPYRATLTNLAPGVNRVTFSFDTAKGSEKKHALDYLASFDYTETTSATASANHANKNDPCGDRFTCNPAAPNATAAITVPPSNYSTYPTSCANGTFTGTPLQDQFVKAWSPQGVGISNMSVAFPALGTSGDCEQKFTVQFTVAAGTSTVVLAWGAHIAANGPIGAGGYWTAPNAVPTGSPYHMHAGFSMESPSGTFYTVGSQDLQLASSAIVQTASGTVTTIHKANGDIVPVTTSVPVGTTVYDSAAVTPSTAAGTVTFTFYTSGDCTTGSSAAGTVTLVSGVASPSDSRGPLSAGSYSFKAHYNGLSPDLPSDSDCEPFTVAKASPTLPTTPSPTSGAFGAILNDSATVTGGYNPTGSVTFSLWDPDQATCTGTARYTETVPLSSGSATTTNTTFLTDKAGTWNWTASYGGDTNNNTAISGCDSEAVVIGKVTPTSTTAPTAKVIPNDSISLSGLQCANGVTCGTVTFKLFQDSATCAEASLQKTSSAINVVGGTDTYSTSFTDEYEVSVDSTFYWRVTYSGDSNNNGFTTDCTAESIAINITPDPAP